MVGASHNGFIEMIRSHVELLKSLLPRKYAEPVVADERAEPVRPAADPLPPCKPLNRAEANEAATLAQLRGALYPTEA